MSMSDRTVQQFCEVFHLASREPRVNFAHVPIPALSDKEDVSADFSTRGSVAAGFLYGSCNGDSRGRVIADYKDGQYVPVAIMLDDKGEVLTPDGQKDTTGELAEKLSNMRVRQADCASHRHARMG